jgi:hypothetical protein
MVPWCLLLLCNIWTNYIDFHEISYECIDDDNWWIAGAGYMAFGMTEDYK